jgi:hypothetical protein
VVSSLRVSVKNLEIDGDRAKGTFGLSAVEPTTRQGATTLVVILLLATERLSLEEVAGRWLVSSQARLLSGAAPLRRGSSQLATAN